MRAKLILLSAFVVGTVGGSLASGCQTYDFEPVEPLALAQTTKGDVIKARSLKPNMMVLLDTSGSMTLPADVSRPACRVSNPSNPSRPYCGDQGNPPCDVATCPTRWSELRGAMGTFLGTSGSVARLGLTTYPAAAAGQCGASSSVRIPIPQVEDTDQDAQSKLQASANSISNVILNEIALNGQGGPIGGTPTSLSLRFVGDQPDLQGQERDDFVLLLTDGLPNCNPNNPNGGNATACQCTQSTCTGFPALLCLDKDASVAAVTDLRSQKAIRTIVIGFGADFTGGEMDPGYQTLNAMAVAGAFPRTQACTTATQVADCGSNDTCCAAGDATCEVDKCKRRFYLASNQTELRTALDQIINLVGTKDVCLLELDPTQRPSDDNLLVVYFAKGIDAKLVALPQIAPQGAPNEGEKQWELNQQGVRFLGSKCAEIQASTPQNPVTIEVRAVQRK